MLAVQSGRQSSDEDTLINRRGFTFIELMIVIAIMGLLSAIALNRLFGSRDRSFVAAMRSDIRNLTLAQESYFYDNDTYGDDVTALENHGFTITTGVSFTVNEATVTGWSATVSHAVTAIRCYVFVGAAAPVGSATQQGEISCS